MSEIGFRNRKSSKASRRYLAVAAVSQEIIHDRLRHIEEYIVAIKVELSKRELALSADTGLSQLVAPAPLLGLTQSPPSSGTPRLPISSFSSLDAAKATSSSSKTPSASVRSVLGERAMLRQPSFVSNRPDNRQLNRRQSDIRQIVGLVDRRNQRFPDAERTT